MGGADTVAIARKLNYLDIGESIDPLDWEPDTPTDSIVSRVINRKNEMTKAGLSGNIILLHDAGGEDRSATVEACPGSSNITRPGFQIFHRIGYPGQDKGRDDAPRTEGQRVLSFTDQLLFRRVRLLGRSYPVSQCSLYS